VQGRSDAGSNGETTGLRSSTRRVSFCVTSQWGSLPVRATYRFDEFGEPESGSAGRFGWLGGKVRRTELSSGVIQMGARSYIPQLGRFLTPDPVAGGSANAYDYADQDPVNLFDLDGDCPKKGRGEKFVRQGQERAIQRIQTGKQPARPKGNSSRIDVCDRSRNVRGDF
jgi:RHS repeat-associated protein